MGLHELDSLVLRGKLNELLQPPELGLFLVRTCYPGDGHSPVKRREALEVLPRLLTAV